MMGKRRWSYVDLSWDSTWYDVVMVHVKERERLRMKWESDVCVDSCDNRGNISSGAHLFSRAVAFQALSYQSCYIFPSAVRHKVSNVLLMARIASEQFQDNEDVMLGNWNFGEQSRKGEWCSSLVREGGHHCCEVAASFRRFWNFIVTGNVNRHHRHFTVHLFSKTHSAFCFLHTTYGKVI